MNKRLSLLAKGPNDGDLGGDLTLGLRSSGDEVEPAAHAPSAAMCRAQQDIVGAILIDNGIVDDIGEYLQADDFTDPACRLAFELAAQVRNGDDEVATVADPVTISLLSKGQVSLEQLQSWVDSADVDDESVMSRARMVADAAQERRLESAYAASGEIISGAGSVQERAEMIASSLEMVADRSAATTVGLGASAVSALQDLAKRVESGEQVMGISYGIEELDAVTTGAHPGELIIVAARPGIGKTALALGFGLAAAAQRKAVAIVTLEMIATELGKRALTIKAGVDGQALRKGALTEEEWERLITAAEEINQLPIEVIEEGKSLPKVTATALRSAVRRLHKQGKCDMLILDYLQLMEGGEGRKGDSRENQVAAISRELKRIARSLKIPVVALSQLNRAVESRPNRRPQLSDLRESGALEQDADVIMFIYREPSEDTARANLGGSNAIETVEIIIAKQRAGPAPVTVEVGFQSSTTRFSSLINQHRNMNTALMAA